MDLVRGLARSPPLTAGVLIVGGLEIAGMPPFSLFVSEFAILSEAFAQSRYLIGGVFLIVLSLVFGGFLSHLLRMISGAPQDPPPKPHFARAEFAGMDVAAQLLVLFCVSTP